MTRLLGRAAASVALLIALVLAPSSAAGADLTGRGWVWPLRGLRIVEAYVAPVDDYAPGHRGIDLAPVGEAGVRSPAEGVVAFSGDVAGRGILTIDHGDGLVTTLEPIRSELRPGDVVPRGAEVGSIAVGGHAAPGTVHFGVRLDGRYINPLLLLGGVPRAVLLPCCD
ncbi:murein hydrolase activator EnvC family protein [Microbacterium sp. ASV49]|uniref:M23 family metallopeptidase n=1 Tax=Microbacterium candidum TaxID=3041922 RepID=A0ABT7MZS4_9MICO|nr:M23 family metallopeptidase [Microbacterium sp. ASV49]MDL9979958.1 M23 family metallopeptidase [Microbacterium sp. ASV49]